MPSCSGEDKLADGVRDIDFHYNAKVKELVVVLDNGSCEVWDFERAAPKAKIGLPKGQAGTPASVTWVLKPCTGEGGKVGGKLGEGAGADCAWAYASACRPVQVRCHLLDLQPQQARAPPAAEGLACCTLQRLQVQQGRQRHRVFTGEQPGGQQCHVLEPVPDRRDGHSVTSQGQQAARRRLCLEQ